MRWSTADSTEAKGERRPSECELAPKAIECRTSTWLHSAIIDEIDAFEAANNNDVGLHTYLTHCGRWGPGRSHKGITWFGGENHAFQTGRQIWQLVRDEITGFCTDNSAYSSCSCFALDDASRSLHASMLHSSPAWLMWPRPLVDRAWWTGPQVGSSIRIRTSVVVQIPNPVQANPDESRPPAVLVLCHA